MAQPSIHTAKPFTRTESLQLSYDVYNYTHSQPPEPFNPEQIRLWYERLSDEWIAQVTASNHDYVRGQARTPDIALRRLFARLRELDRQ